MFLIASIAFAIIIAMACLLGGSMGMFINSPSAIIVFIPALLAAKVRLGAESMSQMFKTLFTNGVIASDETKALYQASLSTMSQVAVTAGWLGVLIGAVAMASNIEPQHFSQVFGPAFAVCILTILYGYIVKAFCILADAQLAKADNKPVEKRQVELA